MTKEELKAMISIVIYNCVTIVSFTTLAIVVNKWWIIFFALMFVQSCSYKPKDK